MNKSLFSIIFVSLFSLTFSFSQDSVTVRDFESWNSIGLEKKFFDKKLSLSLDQELRLDGNSSHVNNYFTDLQVDYIFFGSLETGVGFRFLRNKKKDGYVNERRLNFDISYNHKIQRIKMGYRFRFQNRRLLSGSGEDNQHPVVKYRFRVKGAYNIRNWKPDPYFSGEIFFTKEMMTVNYIEMITEENDISGFEKLRIKIGVNYPIKKFGKLGLFYGFEKEFKSYPKTYNTPATFYLAGLSFNFKL